MNTAQLVEGASAVSILYSKNGAGCFHANQRFVEQFKTEEEMQYEYDECGFCPFLAWSR